MPEQHFVMLAFDFDEAKHGIGGWYASEKLDGQRALWIPETRGLPKSEVPFANTDKDERYQNIQIATGLWSRYGNVIHAPDEWLDQLPNLILDGELYLRRGQGGRQDLARIIKTLNPDVDAWEDVTFNCFDLPPPEVLFADRGLKLTNFKKQLSGVYSWWKERAKCEYTPKPETRFETTLFMLDKYLGNNEVAIPHPQYQLSFTTHLALEQVRESLHQITEAGGEGIILREPSSSWVTHRSHKLVKIKKLRDDEGVVLGYVSGRRTDKGSKLLGMMGALILDYKGKRFELSGFTDEERRLDVVGECRAEIPCTPEEWASEYPGEELPDWIEAPAFPRGTVVSFKYRTITKAGIPEEARYWRKR